MARIDQHSRLSDLVNSDFSRRTRIPWLPKRSVNSVRSARLVKNSVKKS